MPAPPEHTPSGLRLATIGGIPVYIGSSWFLLAAIIVALIGPQIAASNPDLGAAAYAVALAHALGLLVAVLVHEASHAGVARLFGHTVHAVVADLWGGHTTYDPTKGRPGSAAAIAGVGPLSNGILGFVAFLLLPVVPAGIPSSLVGAFALVNGLLALFNLLPGLPLDGGQLVEALVWKITGTRHTGRVVAGWCGRVVAGLVVLWAVLPLLSGEGLDPFRVIWVLLIAAFLWRGASAAVQAGESLGVLARIDPDSVIRPAVAVHERSVVADVSRHDEHAWVPVVIDAGGRPTAMISGAALDSVPAAERAHTPVAAVMAPQPPEWVVALDGERSDQVRALVQAFQEHDLAVLAVTRGGRMVGVVSVHELGDALRRAQGQPGRARP